MSIPAIRGATCLQAGDTVEMESAVVELMQEILARNALTQDDLISVIFTSTPDLVSGLPATAARSIGFSEVPLMCAQEIPVAGAMERVSRVMVHADTDQPRAAVEHVFLRGAQALRGDIADS